MNCSPAGGLCSVLAATGSDGEDGAKLPMLADEAVVLISLRNAGAGLTF